MALIKLKAPNSIIGKEISLSGSKSISNRVLIIRALCQQDFEISNLSNSEDTKILTRLLDSEDGELNAGHAGTCYRFMTAFLSFKKEEQILTGSDQMKKRPIGDLVEALRHLGANITYLENEGYPPLLIKDPNTTINDEVNINAGTSSQFISALCLVAPTLPNGLKINLVNEAVSMSYLMMTLEIMKEFGVNYQMNGKQIHIRPQSYQARDYLVEGDWSSASYHFNYISFSKGSNLKINNLKSNSFQGDSAIAEIFKSLGVETSFEDSCITLRNRAVSDSSLNYDFVNCPDIFQTVIVACAMHGIEGRFSGLKTLRIKETDRIAAMQTELKKIGANLEVDNLDNCSISSTRIKPFTQAFKTYDDHRMAMALSALAFDQEVLIEDHEVVKKSYTDFWKDLISLGFELTKID